MNRIILLSCLALLGALHAHGARRHANNPIVQCAFKVDKIKTQASPSIMQLARAECQSDPSAFDAMVFLLNNPLAVCERKISSLSQPNAPDEMIDLSRIECAKNPRDFNTSNFYRDWNLCYQMTKTMTSMWKGFRKKARRECVALDDSSKFDLASFTKRNIDPPLISATP